MIENDMFYIDVIYQLN